MKFKKIQCHIHVVVTRVTAMHTSILSHLFIMLSLVLDGVNFDGVNFNGVTFDGVSSQFSMKFNYQLGTSIPKNLVTI